MLTSFQCHQFVTPSRTPTSSCAKLEMADALRNVFERTGGIYWHPPQAWRPDEANPRTQSLEHWTGVQVEGASDLVELRMKNVGLEGETPRGVSHNRLQDRIA